MLQRRTLIMLFVLVAVFAWFELDAWQWLNRVAMEITMSRQSTTVPIMQDNELAEHFVSRHREILKYTADEGIELVLMGDSIAENFPSRLWVNYFDNSVSANFGVNGDRTQQVIWRIENGELDRVRPRVIVLQIGTNNIARNDPQSIARGVARIISEIQTKLPKTKILLMGIFPRERGGDGARADIAATNLLYAKLADGKRVRFLDIGEKFLDETGHVPESIGPDKLHLSEQGYEIWGEAIAPTVREMLDSR